MDSTNFERFSWTLFGRLLAVRVGTPNKVEELESCIREKTLYISSDFLMRFCFSCDGINSSKYFSDKEVTIKFHFLLLEDTRRSLSWQRFLSSQTKDKNLHRLCAHTLLVNFKIILEINRKKQSPVWFVRIYYTIPLIDQERKRFFRKTRA